MTVLHFLGSCGNSKWWSVSSLIISVTNSWWYTWRLLETVLYAFVNRGPFQGDFPKLFSNCHGPWRSLQGYISNRMSSILSAFHPVSYLKLFIKSPLSFSLALFLSLLLSFSLSLSPSVSWLQMPLHFHLPLYFLDTYYLKKCFNRFFLCFFFLALTAVTHNDRMWVQAVWTHTYTLGFLACRACQSETHDRRRNTAWKGGAVVACMSGQSAKKTCSLQACSGGTTWAELQTKGTQIRSGTATGIG